MENDEQPFPEGMSETEKVAELVRLLTLEQQTENHFLGQRKLGGIGRIFGGQVVAQALAAAQLTVADDRRPHSLHAYFLRGGNEDYRIEFSVERDFDGGSFSNRRVIAAQNGVPILNLIASFHRHEDGYEHAAPMPDVPGPEDLEREDEVIRRLTGDKDGFSNLRRNRGYEVRIPGDRFLSGQLSNAPAFVWFKVMAPLPDDPAIHRLVLTYLSDYGLLSASLFPHDISLTTSAKVRPASLDHAIWFHCDARADDWLLYALDSPWAGNARGFNRGSFYTRDGRLVASTAQEGLIRPIKPKG
ncbi:acyl-CoA thioesterase [Croceicoccus mobilis]|uniref:Acyl-CoA thioesterase 2 n=1 Tax=Croceicoccus mobilis TaxID=1703339 RepID=A0A916Z5Y2_9SPHN|nr:acyl-CoA thioesterase domain-containing protein [Croceicoccus mobilis]GGD77435.1 acyl-CoA thioesterase II [Croceicoccus mobilis]